MIKNRNCRKYGSAVLRQSHDRLLLKLGHLCFHHRYRDGSAILVMRRADHVQTNRDCSTTALATCEAPFVRSAGFSACLYAETLPGAC
jgi:hypothetical protein